MTGGSPIRSAICGPRYLGVEKVPVHQYISSEFFEREKDAIWRRAWLLVGRVNEIPRPGDYFLFDLEVVNTSVLVVRGRDGRIRAFYNACKHRGAKVCYQISGSARALTCSFHGWVYDLEGKLVNVPFKEQFPDCAWDSVRLKPVALDTWGGFIFINLAPQPHCSLREYLQPLPDPLEKYFAGEDWQFYFGYKGVFKANWKIMVDVQAEGHHAPFLHRRSVTGAFLPEDMPTVAFPDSLGVPYRLGASRPRDDMPGAIQQTTVSRLALKYGVASLYTQHGAPSAADRYPGAVNIEGSNRWIFDDYAIFPNTVFLIMDGQVLIQRCWPLSQHQTLWEINHYFAGPVKSFGDLFNREQGVLGEWNTITEDMVTVEGIYQSFRSGAVDGMILSDLEIGVRNYEKRILEEVAAHSKPGTSR